MAVVLIARAVRRNDALIQGRTDEHTIIDVLEKQSCAFGMRSGFGAPGRINSAASGPPSGLLSGEIADERSGTGSPPKDPSGATALTRPSIDS